MDCFWPISRPIVEEFLSELVFLACGKGFAPAAALWHTAGRISVER
jgi:hypothetical protein